MRVDYREYIVSPEWYERRNAAVRRADGRCQLCNRASNLNVHHRTYERLGSELPSDLTVLCRSCHEHFHCVNEPKVERSQPAKRAKGKKAAGGVLSIPCSLCGVAAGKPCRTTNNKIVKAHAERRLKLAPVAPKPKMMPGLTVACPVCFVRRGKRCVAKREHRERLDLAEQWDQISA